MYPTIMNAIAADQIKDMRANAARDRRASLVRHARLAGRHAAAARRAGHRTTGARELSERHA
ncbi:MAG: hypothetical protein ABSB01_04325 [Streptosporangiaceae bacterium]|jgi:hypothetical protein